MNKLNSSLLIATVGVLSVNVLLLAVKQKGLEKSVSSMSKVVGDNLLR